MGKKATGNTIQVSEDEKYDSNNIFSQKKFLVEDRQVGSIIFQLHLTDLSWIKVLNLVPSYSMLRSLRLSWFP